MLEMALSRLPLRPVPGKHKNCLGLGALRAGLEIRSLVYASFVSHEAGEPIDR